MEWKLRSSSISTSRDNKQNNLDCLMKDKSEALKKKSTTLWRRDNFIRFKYYMIIISLQYKIRLIFDIMEMLAAPLRAHSPAYDKTDFFFFLTFLLVQNVEKKIRRHTKGRSRIPLAPNNLWKDDAALFYLYAYMRQMYYNTHRHTENRARCTCTRYSSSCRIFFSHLSLIIL